MCGIFPANTFALKSSHACILARHYGLNKQEHDGIHAVFAAIHGGAQTPFYAQVEVGLVFVDLILRMQSERGIHTLPFTALQSENSEIAVGNAVSVVNSRLRSPTMQSVHDAVVAFNMSEQKMTAVRSALREHFRFSVVMGHSCDISGIPEELDEPARRRFDTELSIRDSVRSLLNANRNPELIISDDKLFEMMKEGQIQYMNQTDFHSFLRIKSNRELLRVPQPTSTNGARTLLGLTS